jgi:hypothetical protein
MFCEGVQHRLQFCLNQLNCVKMAAFQFYLQMGKKRKIGWVGDNNHVVSGKKKFSGEKRKCKTVCFHDATAEQAIQTP